MVDSKYQKINFVVEVKEINLQDADGINSVEIRLPDSDYFIYTFDNSLGSLNGMIVNNSDWSYTFDRGLHKFVYTGNSAIYAGNSTSRIGIKSTFQPPSNSNGNLPIKVTIKGNSGGQTNRSNDNDEVLIKYYNY